MKRGDNDLLQFTLFVGFLVIVAVVVTWPW